MEELLRTEEAVVEESIVDPVPSKTKKRTKKRLENITQLKKGDGFLPDPKRTYVLEKGYMAAVSLPNSGEYSVLYIIKFHPDKAIRNNYFICVTDVVIKEVPTPLNPKYSSTYALRLREIGETKVRDRLLHFLWVYIQLWGDRSPNGYRMPFAISHELIARSICSTRVTITKMLSEVESLGYIEKEKKKNSEIVLTKQGIEYCLELF